MEQASRTAPAEPSTRRPAHRPSRVDEVVTAAIKVFSRKGLAAATIEEIAEECGMGAGAIYYHFPTREDLFAEAVRSVTDEMAELTVPEGDPGDLAHVVRALYDWAARNPDKARLYFFAAPGSTPEVAETVSDFLDERVRHLYRYVAPDRPPRRLSRKPDLAARTAIRAANLTMMVWVSGDLFAKRTTRHTVADAAADAMLRLAQELGEPPRKR